MTAVALAVTPGAGGTMADVPVLASAGPMVGRGHEMAALADALATSVDGRARVVLLGGEAGIGKTRLVGEFAARASRDALIAVGQCIELGGEGAPYAPAIGALRAVLRDVGAADWAQVLGPGRADLARLLPELGAAAEASDVGRGRLFEAVAALLEHVAERRPVVVVLEDMHWADSSTRELLGFLVRSLRDTRVLLVLTYRTDELTRTHPLRPFIAELERHPRVQRLTLRRLDRAQVGTLLEHLGAAPSAGVVAAVHARSDGIPFFVEAIAAIGADPTVRLPESLRDLLLVRLESLPPRTLDVLRVAAVGGQRVSHELLAAVADLPSDELDAALREAVAAQVLEVDRSRQGYAFRHALVREAVDDDLLPGEHSRLHERWARALEQHPGAGCSSSVAVEIAHHWYESWDVAHAFAAALRAADETRAMYAPREEMLMLERVLELWDRVPDAATQAGADRVSVLTRAAASALRAGENDRSASLIESALRSVSRQADPRRYAHLLVKKVLYTDSLSMDDTVAALQDVLALVPADVPSHDRAAALATLAGCYMVHDDPCLSQQVAEQACEAARAVGDLRTEANALNILALVTCFTVGVEQGLALFEQCRRTAEQAGDEALLVRYRTNLSDVLLGLARYREAADVARAGRQHAEAQGLLRSSGTFLAGNEAEALIALGEWDDALALIDTALGQAPPATSRGHLMVERARLLLRRGDPSAAAAVEALGQVPAWFPGQSQYLLPVAQTQAEAALDRGEPHEALYLLVDALGRVTAAHPASAWGFAHALARSVVATARAGTDAALVTRAAEMLDQARIDFPRSSAQPVWDAVLDAEMAVLDGASAAASAPWTTAAALVAEPSFEGPALLRAYVRYRAARERVQAGDRDGATALLQATLEECHRMGAAPLEAAAAGLARRARLALPGSATPSDGATPAAPLGLTAREQQVLALLAAGRSNAQIAQELFISPKTASVHVSNILTKLGVGSRGEAAARAHAAGLVG